MDTHRERQKEMERQRESHRRRQMETEREKERYQSMEGKEGRRAGSAAYLLDDRRKRFENRALI